MSINRRHVAAAVMSLAILGSAVTLTGCGNAVQGAVEKAAGDAIGGNVDINSNGLSITDSNGNQVQVGSDVSLPDNWPSSVPVFDGGKLATVMVAGDGASVNAMWTTDAATADAAKAYADALTAAGYTQDQASSAGPVASSQWTGNGYQVDLVVTGADGKTSVLVTAEKASESPSPASS